MLKVVYIMNSPIMPDPDEISSDISSLYEDSTAEDAESNVQRFIKSKLPELPVADIDYARTHLQSSVTENMIFSNSEGHVYYVADQFYKELVKAARKYNKFICKQTGKKLNGKRVLKDPSKGVKWSATFNPFIYVLTLKTPVYANPDDIVPEDVRVTTFEINAETSDEAHLRMATQLGFSEIQRKEIASHYHPETVKKILEDPRYLRAIRQTETDKEYLRQIKEMDYVPVDRRKMWIYEVQERIQKLQQELENKLL
jgi:hypothetical protein